MLKASRFIHFPLLIELPEMETLLRSLPPFEIFNIGEVKEDVTVTKEAFLEAYGTYVKTLQEGNVPTMFAGALTTDPQAIEIQEVPNGRKLAKTVLPVLQFRPYHFSKGEDKIRSLNWGGEMIHWGLQFSFPQIYARGGAVEKSKESPNFSLFKAMQKWVRHNTKPTPITLATGTLMTPIRTSESALVWRQDAH